MQGPMMPMQQPRRRPDGLPAIGALAGPDATMMGPLAAAPAAMGPPMMDTGLAPDQAEELRRWFMQNRSGGIR